MVLFLTLAHTMEAMDSFELTDCDEIAAVARRILQREPTNMLIRQAFSKVLIAQVALYDNATFCMDTPESFEDDRTRSRVDLEVACLEEILGLLPFGESPSRMLIMLKLTWCRLHLVRKEDKNYKTFINSIKRTFEEVWKPKHLVDPEKCHMGHLIRREFLVTLTFLYALTGGIEYLERLEELCDQAASKSSDTAAGEQMILTFMGIGPPMLAFDQPALMKGLASYEKYIRSNDVNDLRSSATHFDEYAKHLSQLKLERADEAYRCVGLFFSLRSYNRLFLATPGRYAAEKCRTHALSVLNDPPKSDYFWRRPLLHLSVKCLLNHFLSDCVQNAQSLRESAKWVLCEELMDGTSENWERLGQLGFACERLWQETYYMPTIDAGIKYLRLSIEGTRSAAHLTSLAKTLLYRRAYLARVMEYVVVKDTDLLAHSTPSLLPDVSHEVDIFQTKNRRYDPKTREPEPELMASLVSLKMDGGLKHIGDEEWYPLLAEASELARGGGPLERMQILKDYATFCAVPEHRKTSIAALEEALTVLQSIFISQPSIRSQRNILHAGKGSATRAKFLHLPFQAAYYAIIWKETRHAVEFLEYGRSLIWSRMRGMRTTEMELQGVEEGTINRFAKICEELEEIVTLEARQDRTDSDSKAFSFELPTKLRANVDSIDHHSDIVARKEELDGEFDLIVKKIRETPGHEYFLQMVPFDKLQSAACEGPVIILTMCTEEVFRSPIFGLGCAIIVLDSQDPIVVTLGEGENFVGAVASINTSLWEIRRRPGYSNDKLLAVLKVIGELIVKDVVAALLSLGIMEQSRIWWCLTSMFASFPIHAALWENHTGDGKTKFMCLSDIYVSSYTPSLTALIHARLPPSTENATMAHEADATTRTPMLIIRQQDEHLPSADQEVENIVLAALNANHTPDSLKLYEGDSDNERQKILDDLPKHGWIHLVSHGMLDAVDPFLSHFQISAGKITLMDILKSKVPNAEFAFLSACHTAELPPNIFQDESLHLAAAMQFCGFRSVIGTMWPMRDEDGPRVAKAFYEDMFAVPNEGEEFGYKRSAWALNRVVQKMRRHKDFKQTPERWVNFVHIGA